jgi:hypothetical protein
MEFVARIEGTAESLLALLRIPEVTIFEHTDQKLGDDLWSVEAALTEEAAEAVRELGCQITVLRSVGEIQRHDAAVRQQIRGWEPVQLVLLRGPGQVLGNLSAVIGLNLPLYTARALEEGEWEGSTEANEDTIAALRGVGVEVTILEDAARLAQRRGEN